MRFDHVLSSEVCKTKTKKVPKHATTSFDENSALRVIISTYSAVWRREHDECNVFRTWQHYPANAQPSGCCTMLNVFVGIVIMMGRRSPPPCIPTISFSCFLYFISQNQRIHERFLCDCQKN